MGLNPWLYLSDETRAKTAKAAPNMASATSESSGAEAKIGEVN